MSKPYRKVLVPVDGSAASTAALRESIRVSGTTGRLRLIHVLDEIAQARIAVPAAGAVSADILGALEKAGTKALADAEKIVRNKGVGVETAMLRSRGRDVANIVLNDAKRWGAELIAMGTEGRRGLSRLLMGSNAEAVLRRSSVPLLLVPARRTRASSAKK